MRARPPTPPPRSTHATAAPAGLGRWLGSWGSARRCSSRDVGLVIFQIPLRDLLAGGEPNIVERLRIGNEIVQRADAERLTDDVGVQADVHKPAADRTFAVQPIEAFLEDSKSAVHVLALPHEHREVVDLRRIRYGNDRSARSRF